ncbi:MAG: hypothetical protein U0792_09235 [Gemmataceae bacterium]
MLSQLLARATTPAPPRAESPLQKAATPDAGYEALTRLTQLAADMATAVPVRTRSRWHEPLVFFFDGHRQADLEAARGATPAPAADAFEGLSARIASEVSAMCRSVEVRRVARATPGLRQVAEAMAPVCVAARELADLLAVPDDEVVTVLHPGLNLGFRVVVRGVADAGQFQVLLLDAAKELLPGPRLMERFVAACSVADPQSVGGVPMVMEARFQMYGMGALRPGGVMPQGFGGNDHWLWPHTPLASLPIRDGERIVLLGPPAYRATWEVTRRFPSLPAEVRVLETLTPSQVAERVGKLGKG